MKDRANGTETPIPRIPLAYKVLLYRRRMHLSYQDVVTMPLDAFNTDFEMMDIEATGRIRVD